MRDLRRNRQPVWYAQYLGEQPILDEDGQEIGETGPAYSETSKAMVNISPATGMAENQLFGNFADYTHTIATVREFPFDEQTVMWVGVTTDKPYNFKVMRVAKSLNGWVFALKAENVRDGE